MFVNPSKTIILNVDDLGLHRRSLLAAEELWSRGLISSVSILANGPSLEESLGKLREMKIPCGVHLTLSDGPPLSDLSEVPGLIDQEGQFLSDINPETFDLPVDQVRKEFRTQVERILESGVRVTHIDSHRFHCLLFPELHEVYRDLGKRYRLPLELPEDPIFDPIRNEVPRSSDGLKGIYSLEEESYANRVEAYDRMLAGIKPGITYIFSHPVFPLKEGEKEFFGDAPIRLNDFALFTSEEWPRMLERHGIRMHRFICAS